MIAFLIRLVGYGLVLGVASRIAQSVWLQDGLDAVGALQNFHDRGVTLLLIAPIVLALLGVGPLRRAAIFVAFALAAAALTAPFALARVVGA